METAAEMIDNIRLYAGPSGVCGKAVATQGMKYLNLGRRLLWNKTDGGNTTGWYCIKCFGGCVTLPSEIEQVRLASLNGIPISIGNEWYESIPQIGTVCENNSCLRKMIQEGSSFVTFQDYTAGDYQIAFQAESPLDQGIEITPTGMDKYGTRYMETVTLQNPPTFAKTTQFFKDVLSVVKPRTKGRIRMYAFDPNVDRRLLLAVYQPYDTNPQFLRYKIAGCKGCNPCLTVYAKRKYYDLVDMNELVEYSLEALVHSVTAVVNRENRDLETFQANLALAVAEVNRDTANRENDVGTPLRRFAPDLVDNLIPGYGDGYGWGIGGGYWS